MGGCFLVLFYLLYFCCVKIWFLFPEKSWVRAVRGEYLVWLESLHVFFLWQLVLSWTGTLTLIPNIICNFIFFIFTLWKAVRVLQQTIEMEPIKE